MKVSFCIIIFSNFANAIICVRDSNEKPTASEGNSAERGLVMNSPTRVSEWSEAERASEGHAQSNVTISKV